MTDTNADRARLIGLNHVALPVGDVDEALEFYRDVFEVALRGRSASAAFIDMGDQFLPLMEADPAEARDERRHVGVVVDDPDLVRARLDDLGVAYSGAESLDFHDPWGNRLQVVAYEGIQFTKADHVREGMGLSDLEKTDAALAELAEKGMAPDER